MHTHVYALQTRIRRFNAESLIRHGVATALLVAGARASSPLPIRLRCAIALNNLCYHHAHFFARTVLVVSKDRRMARRGAAHLAFTSRISGLGQQHRGRHHGVNHVGLGKEKSDDPSHQLFHFHTQRLHGDVLEHTGLGVGNASHQTHSGHTSGRAKSPAATLLLSMLGDVDPNVRSYTASAVSHIVHREVGIASHSLVSVLFATTLNLHVLSYRFFLKTQEISHKWLVRSGAVHACLLTGLVRASRDEATTRRTSVLALMRLCAQAGRKWLRRRPFTTPRVVWAATALLIDGDYHKSDPRCSFDNDSGELRELGLVLLCYLSATPQGRALVGNGTTLCALVECAKLCIARGKRQQAPGVSQETDFASTQEEAEEEAAALAKRQALAVAGATAGGDGLGAQTLTQQTALRRARTARMLNSSIFVLSNLFCGIGSGVKDVPIDPLTGSEVSCSQ